MFSFFLFFFFADISAPSPHPLLLSLPIIVFPAALDSTLRLLELRRDFFFLQYSLVVNHTAAHAILNNHTKSFDSLHALTDYAKVAAAQFSAHGYKR